jgi:integrase
MLTDVEMAEVWATVNQMTHLWGAFFRMALLTLQRRAEVARIRWSERSPDCTMWVLPAARRKNGKPHHVHLAESARATLGAITKIDKCDYVIRTTGQSPVSGFAKAKATLTRP